MCLKNYKPVTPAQRGRISLDLSQLKINPETKNFLKPILKFLKEGKTSKAGRNNQGRITVRHRGGGHKRKYLKVQFSRNVIPELLEKYFGTKAFTAKVQEFIYDPNRNTSAALLSISLPTILENEETFVKDSKKANLFYNSSDNSLWYIILNCKGLAKGDELCVSKAKPSFHSPQKAGEALPVEEIPLGSFIHNIESIRGRGGQVARAAGTYGQIIEDAKESARVRVRLPSGQERWVYYGSYATLGSVSHEEWKLTCIAKAGRNRWRGKRPSVRGVAMNPVDHPHGGGEGRTSGGRPSVTPWGRPTRNWRSSSKKKKKNPFLVLFTEEFFKKKKRKDFKKPKKKPSFTIYSAFAQH